MPKGEVYHRPECGEWIAAVQKLSGLSNREFGEKLVRFRDENGELKVVRYTKGSITNWRRGEHLPSYPETIASIAMLEYDLRMEKGIPLPVSRYTHVMDQMSYYLNKRLYCKNILDLLIFLSAKGMLTLEEIPKVRKDILNLLMEDNEKISEEEKRQYAVNRNTNTLFNILFQQESMEAMKEKICQYRHYYAVGYRALGERIRELYHRNYEKDYRLDFNSAVGIYAPVYRVSFRNMTHDKLEVSRRWLIDLALQLHFNREDINSILSDAQYSELADGKDEAEGWIRPAETEPFGTVGWFSRMEEKYLDYLVEIKEKELEDTLLSSSDFSPLKFWRLQKLTSRQKLIYAYAVGVYMAEHHLEFPVPFYLLDYIPGLQKTGSILKKAETLTSDDWKKEWRMVKEKRYQNESITAVLVDHIMNALKEIHNMEQKANGQCGVANFVADLYDEYEQYLILPEVKLQYIRQMFSERDFKRFIDSAVYQDLVACHYLTALIYTLTTGFLFKGRVSKKEMEYGQYEMADLDSQKNNFLRHIFRMFLKEEPIMLDEQGYFYLKEDKNRTRKMNFTLLLNYLILFIPH